MLYSIKSDRLSCPTWQKLIGETLLEADLVSIHQIKVALQDQRYNPNLLLGEILAIRGWVEEETADFFALDWPNLLKHNSREPLGWYLQQAGFLEAKDVNRILEEQSTREVRFGSLAVMYGFLKQTTLDFFLRYLFPQEFKISFPENQSASDHAAVAQ